MWSGREARVGSAAPDVVTYRTFMSTSLRLAGEPIVPRSKWQRRAVRRRDRKHCPGVRAGRGSVARDGAGLRTARACQARGANLGTTDIRIRHAMANRTIAAPDK